MFPLGSFGPEFRYYTTVRLFTGAHLGAAREHLVESEGKDVCDYGGKRSERG